MSSGEEAKAVEKNMRQARAFKATIVMTRNDGTDPTIEDLDSALLQCGLAYAMPAQPDGPIVISFSYTPPRKRVDANAAKTVLGGASGLGSESQAPKKD